MGEQPSVVDSPPAWHTLPGDEVVEALASDERTGLASEVADRRLADVGPNELGRDEPRRLWRIVLAQLSSPLITILLVALVVTLLIDERVDAAVIAAVLIINTIIGAFQEHKADRSVQALMELASPRSVVVRDGREHTVDSVELVPGDIVLLTSGTRVPADLRLLRAIALEIDESLLTGESTPVTKGVDAQVDGGLAADRTSIAFMGSAVVTGRARGIVVATGASTELGGIAESIRTQTRPETPLQARMRRFANVIAVAVLASTGVAFALGLALGEALDEMFLTAVALAVAVVPEGLPVALTVALALGVRRMAQRNAIIRSLPAVETLGSTDVIGSDKTGTLTANRMTALVAWTADGEWEVAPGATAGRDEVAAHPDGALATALRTAVLSSEASITTVGDEVTERRGDPTETALLEAAHHAGVDATLGERVRTLAAVPFESQLRYSYVVVDEGGPVVRLKGAPEQVIERCSSVRTRQGDLAVDVDHAVAAAARLAERGLRVLATAERRIGDGVDLRELPSDLVLTGLVGMQDPPRDGVAASIGRCHEAGIRVVMITGDHAVTARAIAEQLGIAPAGSAVISGQDVEAFDDDELAAAVRTTDVFARVAPEHKLRVTRALRSHGHVVAVTGDGVNDGPALKAADIGIAMGMSGTDVAREASDMVLTNDNFVSIVDAVEEGRVVFDNVRKVTYFLLSTGAAAIVAIIASIAAGLPLPYTPAALLWLNVVTNGLQDVALAFDRGEPDVLDRPPRSRREGVITGVLWERIALTGAAMALGSLWLFTWAADVGLSAGEQRGAALTTLVIAMTAHVYTARSERRSIVRTHVKGNRFLLVSSALALIVHIGALHWPPTRALLQIAPVTAGGWLRIGVVAIVVVLVSEAHKLVRSRRP